MTVMAYDESEAESETSETSWQEKLSTLVELGDKPAPYLMFFTAEINGTLTNKLVYVRCVVDAVEIGRVVLKPNDSAEWSVFSGFKGQVVSGDKTVRIQFRAASGGQTVKIRRARIIVIKH